MIIYISKFSDSKETHPTRHTILTAKGDLKFSQGHLSISEVTLLTSIKPQNFLLSENTYISMKITQVGFSSDIGFIFV